jgi:DNA adenine methylase
MTGALRSEIVIAPQQRPILRWAGSKRQLLPILGNYWSKSYSRYVEPFAGSCSLFHRLTPAEALLADKNEELMEAYEILRSHPDDVYDATSSLSRVEWLYLSVRALKPKKLPMVERAARFIYLNRNCFNGIFRTNQRGEFNVPFAHSRQGALPNRDEFLATARLLKDAELRAWDFGTTLRHCREGDFVYLDPPYVVEARRVFREYGPRPFDSADMLRLSEHLTKLHRRGVAFVLSYADCSESRAIAKKWWSRRVRVRRNIAGFASNRKQSFELIITNVQHAQ